METFWWHIYAFFVKVSQKHCLNTKTYCFSLKNSHPISDEEILIQSDSHLYGESKMDFNNLAKIHEPNKQERNRISAVVTFRSRQTWENNTRHLIEI